MSIEWEAEHRSISSRCRNRRLFDENRILAMDGKVLAVLARYSVLVTILYYRWQGSCSIDEKILARIARYWVLVTIFAVDGKAHAVLTKCMRDSYESWIDRGCFLMAESMVDAINHYTELITIQLNHRIHAPCFSVTVYLGLCSSYKLGFNTLRYKYTMRCD